VLKNGSETYIINRKSSRQFRRELSSLHGGNRFDPAKRAIASQINAFRGYGRPFVPAPKFQHGGALSISPLTAPTLPGASPQSNAEVLQVSKDLQNLIAATNGRIDRLQVLVNASDVVKEAGKRAEVKKARSL